MSEIEVGRVMNTDEEFCLDISSIITGRTFLASITRWGKSWTARKLTEECFGHAGIIIIDPEGEYASLREKYPFLIIGKDIPIQLETAEFMAEKILETKTSVIIDLSTTEVELGKEYVDAFLKRFFFLETTVRSPYLVVVEEAEDFGPEKGIATATCLDILRNIAKKGGKRGIGLLMIAHRPAWVSKGILSQCSNKAIGRIDWPGDLAVIEEYLRIPKTVIDKVPTLEKGEFLFIGDWVEKTAFVKVGPVKTTHLGYTPEVIPPTPKELQSVIASLQKSLPQILEKIKPTVLPIAEMKAEVKKELEEKYQDRIQGIIKTADEKSERKYKAKIDELQDHIEKLSRSQALQPVAPISDVLEHPIVKSRMLELSDKGRDFLVKVEREPGLTREQLAAFLTTSTNSVANLVERINQIFHATAIIGEGKPLRYKSLLKRLFITDVGKREIEELGRLQRTITEQQATIASLEPQIEELRRKRVEVNELGRTLRQLETEKEGHDRQVFALQGKVDNLEREKQEMIASNKAASALKTAIDVMIGERTPNIKGDPQPSQGISEEMVNGIVEKKLNEKLAKMSTSSGNIQTTVSLEHKVAHFDYQKQEEHFKVDTTNLQGRIIFLITKSFFDQRHNRKEVVTELSNNGWSHDDKEVDATLLELCQKGIFYRKISTGNVFWYSLQPEAKEHIHG
jgi:hypothetical protein